jgi:hypothetical protein
MLFPPYLPKLAGRFPADTGKHRAERRATDCSLRLKAAG